MEDKKPAATPVENEKKEWVAPELIEKSVKKTESGSNNFGFHEGGHGGPGTRPYVS
jgi:hypothetical protein